MGALAVTTRTDDEGDDEADDEADEADEADSARRNVRRVGGMDVSAFVTDKRSVITRFPTITPSCSAERTASMYVARSPTARVRALSREIETGFPFRTVISTTS